MKMFENRYSLTVNFWGFLIIGGLIVRGICGYFSGYFNAPFIILFAAAYTIFTSLTTWHSASKNKEINSNKYFWKSSAAQIISILHLIGLIYLLVTWTWNTNF